MKQGAIVLLLILFCIAPCLGEGPQIRHSIGEHTPPIVRQSVDLWIDATGLWSLRGQVPPGLCFLDQNGHITSEGQLASGNGPGQSSHLLEVHFDLDMLGTGLHSLPMQLVLEGAQGILGLSLASDTWILPLNNDQVRVKRGGGDILAIASGQWLLLELGDRVFSREQEVFFGERATEVKGVSAKGVQSDLWWGGVPLSLEAGDWGDVELHLQGPSRAGNLILHANPYLRLGESWSLSGQILACAGGSADPLIVHLPALPAGVHTLTGSVQALLPPEGGGGELQAIWEGREIFRQVTISRNWFEYGGLQKIKVDASTTLILPSGQTQSIDGKSTVTVRANGLNVVVPWQDPRQPIWTGLPLAESGSWSLAGPIFGGALPDFFLPILLWDQGLSWRLLTRAGSWFADLSPEQQSFMIQGKSGSTRLEIFPTEERALLSSTWQHSTSTKGWQWWENVNSRTGTYSQGKWRFTIAIPRDSGENPSLALQYRSEKVGVRIAPQDVALRFSSATWAWGGRLNPRAFWFESLRNNARCEINSQGFQVHHPFGDRGEVKLQWKKGQNMQMDLRADPWEAYLNIGRSGLSEGGLRYKQASAKGPLLSVIKAGIQLKNQLFLFEVSGELGYVWRPWCTLYLEGGLGGSIVLRESSAQLDLSVGGGVIVKPLPQIVMAAGWNDREKWYVRAGVVVPFVSRKIEGNFE